jgi:hypothetical protein
MVAMMVSEKVGRMVVTMVNDSERTKETNSAAYWVKMLVA